MHYCPKYIEVMPNAARDHVMGVSEMEMDMFDAIIRSFMQSDDKLYHSEGRLRWRHFFESNVLVKCPHLRKHTHKIDQSDYLSVRLFEHYELISIMFCYNRLQL